MDSDEVGGGERRRRRRRRRSSEEELPAETESFEAADQNVEEPRRRRRRRRHREEEYSPTETVQVGVLARQLASLAVFGLFFLFVIAAPIPFGANRDWAWSPMVIAIGVMALLCATGIGGREGFSVSRAESSPLLILIACFLLFVLVVVVQISPFGPAAPASALYAKAAELLGQTIVPIPSLAADLTRNAMLKCLACAALFMIARTMFHDPRWARALILVFVISTAIVVTYAVYMAVTTHSCYVGGYLKKFGAYNPATDRCLASGTFVGSNNFGCFCGMGFVAALGLLFDGRRSRRSRGEYSEEDEHGDANPIAEWFTGRRVMLAALGLYALGGLMLSASRAGAAVTIVAAALYMFLILRGGSRSAMRWAAAGGTVLIVLILFVAGGAFLHKLSLLGETANYNRVVIWKAAIAAFEESPWTGWGLGSFADIFTINQPASLPLPNDKAHSTPLEFLAEVGVLGGIPVFAVCLIPFGACLWAGLRQQHRQLPAVAFAVAAVPILHSTVDFSLQIPAIGFLVAVFLGMGWAHAFEGRARRERSFAMEN